MSSANSDQSNGDLLLRGGWCPQLIVISLIEIISERDRTFTRLMHRVAVLA